MSEASPIDTTAARSVLLVSFSTGLAAQFQQMVSQVVGDRQVTEQSIEAGPLNWIEVHRPPLVLVCADRVSDTLLHWVDECRHVGFHGYVGIVCRELDFEIEKAGLKHGADFFIQTEKDPELSRLRLQAVVRHLPDIEVSAPEATSERLVFGDLVIDNTVREAWLNNEPVELTSAEFDLLWLLSSHAGEVLTREEIFYRLRGIQYDGQDRSVDVRVSRIRPKVGDDPIHPRRIKTIRSKGYLFVKDIDPRPWH